MNEYDVKRLALILAVQAEIEGMKAYNKQRDITNGSFIYNQQNFDAKAEELNNLAHTHNLQLFG